MTQPKRNAFVIGVVLTSFLFSTGAQAAGPRRGPSTASRNGVLTKKQIYEKYFGTAYKAVAPYTNDFEQADWNSNIALTKAFDAHRSGKKITHGFVFTVAKNTAIDDYRRRSRLCPLPQEDEGSYRDQALLFPYQPRAPDPEEDWNRRLDYESALSSVSDLERQVLRLHSQGLGFATIGAELGIAGSTAHALYERGLHKIRCKWGLCGR